VVRLSGELDATAEEAISDTIDRTLADVADGNGDLVLVDLTATTLVDTVGTAALLRAQEAAGELGVDFAVVAPPGAAVEELAACGLIGVLSVASTVEQALITLPRNPA